MCWGVGKAKKWPKPQFGPYFEPCQCPTPLDIVHNVQFSPTTPTVSLQMPAVVGVCRCLSAHVDIIILLTLDVCWGEYPDRIPL